MMMTKAKMRTALKQMMSQNKDGFDMDLTLKFNVDGIKRSTAEKHLYKTMKLVNRELFGKYWQENDRYVAIMPILENCFGAGEYHYHCIAKCPEGKSVAEFADIFMKHWGHTSLGNTKYFRIRTMYDQAGWKHYISKEYSKDSAYALDLRNARYAPA